MRWLAPNPPAKTVTRVLMGARVASPPGRTPGPRGTLSVPASWRRRYTGCSAPLVGGGDTRAHQGRGLAVAGERVGEGNCLERGDGGGAPHGPGRVHRALGVAVVAPARVEEAVRDVELPLERLDDLEHGDVGGVGGERAAATAPGAAHQDPGPGEEVHDRRHVAGGDLARLRELARGAALAVGERGEVEQQPDAVLRSLRQEQPHGPSHCPSFPAPPGFARFLRSYII